MGRRVLVVPKGFIGDIVLTSPVFEAIKRDAPDAHVTALVPPQFADFVRRDIYVDDVITFDRRKQSSGLKGMRALAAQLSQNKFDVAYAFQRSPRTSMLLRLAGIPERVGPADALLSFLFTRKVRSVKRNHEVVRNLQSLQEDLGFEMRSEIEALMKGGPIPASNLFSLRVPEVSHDEISAPLAGLLSTQQPFVVLSPGSAWETKRWDAAGFRKVAELLMTRGMRIVVVGAPDDASACSEVCRDHHVPEGMITNLCARTSLLELIYLIRASSGVVCNDSLALHLASAAKVPTVAVFCATSPLFGFGPWKNRAVVLEKAELFCKPCRRHGSRRCPTGTRACMTGVSAQDVVAAFDDLTGHESAKKTSSSLRVV